MKKYLLFYIMLLCFCIICKSYQIGITQIVEHPALDACRKGVIDKLKELGYEDGKNVKYDIQIAQGNVATAIRLQKNLSVTKRISS